MVESLLMCSTIESRILVSWEGCDKQIAQRLRRHRAIEAINSYERDISMLNAFHQTQGYRDCAIYQGKAFRLAAFSTTSRNVYGTQWNTSYLAMSDLPGHASALHIAICGAINDLSSVPDAKDLHNVCNSDSEVVTLSTITLTPILVLQAVLEDTVILPGCNLVLTVTNAPTFVSTVLYCTSTSTSTSTVSYITPTFSPTLENGTIAGSSAHVDFPSSTAVYDAPPTPSSSMFAEMVTSSISASRGLASTSSGANEVTTGATTAPSVFGTVPSSDSPVDATSHDSAAVVSTVTQSSFTGSTPLSTTTGATEPTAVTTSTLPSLQSTPSQTMANTSASNSTAVPSTANDVTSSSLSDGSDVSPPLTSDPGTAAAEASLSLSQYSSSMTMRSSPSDLFIILSSNAVSPSAVTASAPTTSSVTTLAYETSLQSTVRSPSSNIADGTISSASSFSQILIPSESLLATTSTVRLPSLPSTTVPSPAGLQASSTMSSEDLLTLSITSGTGAGQFGSSQPLPTDTDSVSSLTGSTVVAIDSLASSTTSSSSLINTPVPKYVASAYQYRNTTGTVNCVEQSFYDQTVNNQFLVLCHSTLSGPILGSFDVTGTTDCQNSCLAFVSANGTHCAAATYTGNGLQSSGGGKCDLLSDFDSPVQLGTVSKPLALIRVTEPFAKSSFEVLTSDSGASIASSNSATSSGLLSSILFATTDMTATLQPSLTMPSSVSSANASTTGLLPAVTSYNGVFFQPLEFFEAIYCPDYDGQAIGRGAGIYNISCSATATATNLTSSKPITHFAFRDCINECNLAHIAVPFSCAGINFDLNAPSDNCVLLSSISSIERTPGSSKRVATFIVGYFTPGTSV
ncbi:hypothetical protein AMS68_002033 [Peltaster fructicola]|uniref:Uncharacterized protein n=1 Tax=Peltaster fructicola TaxID=286661 RepID=A0A6H0XPA5_9PEZI|nr:hypothetical protein AMS68_002033 [Peltaster fructicola]